MSAPSFKRYANRKSKTRAGLGFCLRLAAYGLQLNLNDFKQASSTLATANAHGHNHVLDATTLAFDQRMANQT